MTKSFELHVALTSLYELSRGFVFYSTYKQNFSSCILSLMNKKQPGKLKTKGFQPFNHTKNELGYMHSFKNSEKLMIEKIPKRGSIYEAIFVIALS